MNIALVSGLIILVLLLIILQALPCLLLIIIVIGGIIFGVFTATEGSVVAVVYSLFLSLFIYRSISFKEIPQILKPSWI